MASEAFWKNTFQNLGRLTMMRNLVGGDIPNVHSGVVVTTQELANEDFNLVSNILPTFVNNMNTLGTNLTTAKTAIETSISSYITTSLKNDLNAEAGSTVAPGTTASGVINSLVTQMLADGIAISGAAAAGDTGLFGNMFKEVFGRNDLPYYTGDAAPGSTGQIWEGFASFDWQEWDGH